MNEFANTSRKGSKQRSIENIPEFREHLARNGISFQEWEKRNQPDPTTDALRLQIRILNSKFK